MDIEFDFKGDPVGGVITKCKSSHSIKNSLFPFFFYSNEGLMRELSD